MPLLDVSEVLDDPDFADYTLVCKRQTQVVNDDGEAVNTVQLIPFSGVVTADRALELARMAQGSHVGGSITINTTFRLTNGSPGIDSDIVTWNGSDYIVTGVNDYTTYGAGFISASLDLIPLSG